MSSIITGTLSYVFLHPITDALVIAGVFVAYWAYTKYKNRGKE